MKAYYRRNNVVLKAEYSHSSGSREYFSYELWWRRNHKLIFKGSDFSPSPMKVEGENLSKGALYDLLMFLTLKPGDTDREYFASYTPEQLEFAQSSDAETISFEVSEAESKLARSRRSNPQSFPSMGGKLLRPNMKLAQKVFAKGVVRTCGTCQHFLPGSSAKTRRCAIREQVVAVHGDETVTQWLLRPTQPNGCDFYEHEEPWSNPNRGKYFVGSLGNGTAAIFRARPPVTEKTHGRKYRFAFGPYNTKSEAVNVANYQGYRIVDESEARRTNPKEKPFKLGNWSDDPCFYVSVQDGPKFALVLGPFRSERYCRMFAYSDAESGGDLALHSKLLKIAEDADPKSWFYSWGMVKMKDGHRNGVLNQKVGRDYEAVHSSV